MDIEKIYKLFQTEFISKFKTLQVGVFFVVVGETILKDIDNKPVILPIITQEKDLNKLKDIVNKAVSDYGKDIISKYIMSFDVQADCLITSLEPIGENVSNQEKFTISVQSESILDNSYQVF